MQTLKIGQFNNVGASKTATITCPIGVMYHSLIIERSDCLPKWAGKIRVLANSQIIQEYPSLKHLQDINYYRGGFPAPYSSDGTKDNASLAKFKNGADHIHFDIPGLRQRGSEQLTSLVTGLVRPEGYRGQSIVSLVVEIEMSSDVSGSPKITLYGNIADNMPSSHAGLISKWYHRPGYTAAAAGVYQINDLPKSEIWALLLLERAGNVGTDNFKDVELIVGNRSIRNRTLEVNTQIINEFGYHTMETDGGTASTDNSATSNLRSAKYFYPIDFTEDGTGREMLSIGDGVQATLNVNFKAASTANVLLNTLGVLRGGQV